MPEQAVARDRRLAVIGDKALVHDERGIEARPAPPHEPQNVLGPSPTADRLRPPIEGQRTAHLPAGDRFIGRHEARQRGPEILVKPLVGVDAEHPRLRRELESELLLPRVAEPGLMDEPNRKAPPREPVDDRKRPIGRAGVDDDNLGEPGETLQTFVDAGRLVEADDRRARRERARRPRLGRIDRRPSRGIG